MTDGSKLQFSEKDRDLICESLQYDGVGAGTAILEKMKQDGLSERDVFLEVLGPAAHHFDRLWNEDRVRFLEVGVATMRIEAVLDDRYSKTTPADLPAKPSSVFASFKDDQHTIGVKIAACVQRSKGWDIQLLLRTSQSELLSELEKSSVSILGLSVGSSSSLPDLYPFLRSLRRRRPDVKVLVSGALIANGEHPVHFLNADACAVSFEEAEVMLDAMAVETISRRGH